MLHLTFYIPKCDKGEQGIQGPIGPQGPAGVTEIISYSERYLDEFGNIDVDKLQIITYDMTDNSYRVLGEVVGKAFKDGLKLKD